MGEPLLSIFAVLLILYMGRVGGLFGLFEEITTLLLVVFAVMMTLRYWYASTKFMWWLTLLPASSAAFAGFWALLLIVSVPLLVLTKLITEDCRPEYPKILDRILGFVFGTTSAAILVCCLMTSLSVVMPKYWDKYDRTALVVPWDEIPLSAFRHVEQNWLHIPETDPGHTRLPTLEKADADDLEKFWR